ncbi:MAG: DUF1501 domain-containing protein [Solirubrobacterales bacterium]
MACDCREHSRSAFIRQAAAQAGQGLPPVEPGMPLPAGTGLSRRSFLMRSGAAMLSVYGASRLGFSELEAGIAQAQAGAGSEPILVSVFLDGGADSLSVLAPVNDSRYQQWRPTLKLNPGDGFEFGEDPDLRWHPEAENLDTLHREGKVTVFPAIGYDHPDQSHFTSRHYWEVGELSINNPTGWMGRFLDLVGTADNPLQGLSLDGWLSPALATANVPVAAVDGPAYDLWTPGVWDDGISELMFEAAQGIGQAHATGADLGRAKAGNVESQAMRVRAELENLPEEDVPELYPDASFGRNLAALASMLGVGLPIRCAALSGAGGYDTHEGQAGSFGAGLGTTVDALYAFQRDLEARGLDNRVVTLVWSEFGRRPEENGSGGTDHGAGGGAFLIGTPVAGQMVGEFPGLSVLDDDDNLRSTSDFRSIYCSLLEQWFDQDVTDGLIPGQSGFARPTLIG